MAAAFAYERRRPESTTLYEGVRDNVETLYAAMQDAEHAIPKFVRKELEGYLDCGLLCRGFAHLKCEGCAERRLVAFSCKGRGFCPSCMGRRMAQTAANLVEEVLPKVALRQGVLTLPYPTRHRLAYNAKLLGKVTRAFLSVVLAFYQRRLGVSGCVAVVQRTSSDLKCNPHIHAVFLDGGYVNGPDGEPMFQPLPHLRGRDVADVLVRAHKRIQRVLARANDDEPDDNVQPLLTRVTGQPPAGPAFKRGAPPVPTFSTHELCARLEGYDLHAATRAGAADDAGREALLRYVLRPPIAQERVVAGPDGLVRIVLKKRFSDGTLAVDMDPLSLLMRLCAAVPAPRFYTVRYAGVLAAASKWRPRIVPRQAAAEDDADSDAKPKRKGSRYWPWAQLMARTFALDVEKCPKCQGRMKLVALVQDPKSVARLLRHIGEPREPPARAPARAPPYYKTAVIRRLTLGDHAA